MRGRFDSFPKYGDGLFYFAGVAIANSDYDNQWPYKSYAQIIDLKLCNSS